MNGQWSKEQAWKWYNARPWIRGCNFMSSDCANRIDEWQEFGFEARFLTAEREIALAESIGYNSVRIILEFEVWDAQHDSFMEHLDRYLAMFYKHGITAMLVLANDCTVPKSLWKPAVMGPQAYDIGYHGGRKVSPHKQYHVDEPRWHIMDDPCVEERYYTFVREIITLYAHDERVIIWNIFNEPGNGRGTRSLRYMENIFEIAWKIAPDQPLCADVWSGMKGCRAVTEMEQRALELSDVISWHNYGTYDHNVLLLEQLRQLDRPSLNTEWLNRIGHNNVEELYPLFYLEKIGCYNWGFVAGKYQTYEPWETYWDTISAGGGRELDITKWQHDLFRPSLRPYDPREIEIIKRYNRKADERFKSGVDKRLFGWKFTN